MARKVNFQYSFVLLLSSLSLIGCLATSDQGTQTVGSQTTTPPDFTTHPPQDENQDPDETTPPVPAPAPIPVSGRFSGIDLIVNNGAARTKERVLHIDLPNPQFAEIGSMKIGFTSDCSDGQWEPYVASLDISVPQPNSALVVSVRYRDYENFLGPCLTRTIVHDDQGPKILFTRYPTTLEQGSRAQLAYTLTDLSAVTSVVCQLNQLTKTCQTGSNEVEITEMPEGVYTFAIEATDELGNSSRQQVSWNVVSTTKHLVQTILVNAYNKVDILVVDDNSRSMKYEQESMASRVSNFLAILRGLDWRIAVTTTDPTETPSVNTTNPKSKSGMKAPANSKNVYPYVSDGLFLPISGLPGQFYIDSSMGSSEAQERLGLTLQRSESGSGSEQAINATYRSIERGVLDSANNPVQHNFFRDGANFAVVTISDEDESANGVRNDPQGLISLVHDAFNGQKAFSWHSIITIPKDEKCLKDHGATYGERYYQLSLLTGGLIGSVCAKDYAGQLVGIANKIRELVKTMTLSCQPLAQYPITVSKDGQPYSGAFVVEGVNLRFDAELLPGSYSIDYQCLK